MRLVWLRNFIPIVWRHYITGLFPMQSRRRQKNIRIPAPKRHSYPHGQQAWNMCGPYSEFKRATVACSKFKITETQNENSQSLYSWKIPKFGQILGKLGSGSGLKCQNCGELRTRAKFRKYMLKYTWKIYRATLDQGGIEPPTDPNRPYCSCLVGH